mmetsp:Transcript_48461/g.128353  ORF Transcript_48461/g.128353 Transcript_48461/m.128353 type:complete len:123 (-) Transcript_48461:205-573(-)
MSEVEEVHKVYCRKSEQYHQKGTAGVQRHPSGAEGLVRLRLGRRRTSSTQTEILQGRCYRMPDLLKTKEAGSDRIILGEAAYYAGCAAVSEAELIMEVLVFTPAPQPTAPPPTGPPPLASRW